VNFEGRLVISGESNLHDVIAKEFFTTEAISLVQKNKIFNRKECKAFFAKRSKEIYYKIDDFKKISS
jgi:hypothetical protein